MPPLVGVIGKTNVGKSTFFAAATMLHVEISNRPFTTIEPNIGIAYLRKKCVCRELGVKDNPRNSLCINGERFIPVKLVDIAGLIPGAHKGRGLGNKFLDNIRQADALIHVIDASGSTDEEGRPVPPGTHDPLDDVLSIEREVDMWLYQILRRDWQKLVRQVDSGVKKLEDAIADRLVGLSIDRSAVIKALKNLKLENVKASSIRDEELKIIASEIRKIAKPIIIAANKADIPEAIDNIKRLQNELSNRIVIPVSALSELALRKAANKGLIKYIPGDPTFEIVRRDLLTHEQMRALKYIEERVLKVWGSTGVQQVINSAFFKLLDMIVVYPVEDHNKLTDHSGRVLPDALLVKRGTTARELAYKIHTDLGKTFLYAIDARSKRRLGEDYILKDNDVIKIVAAKARK
ncbi:MAG TPA: redox-regulated ATPase YchF [Desulfurococcales archaeon]|nr:redox-regulated ATPase YchF [Desulfurococcales archaeon]